ncbi:unnamed protein product [Ixodes persulcatus]
MGDIAMSRETYRRRSRQAKTGTGFTLTDRGPRFHRQRRRHRHRERAGKNRRRTRAATARPERLWDHAVIPYEIEANFSGDEGHQHATCVRHAEAVECLPADQRGLSRIHPFIKRDVRACRPRRCCSFVGKRGNGAQAISIGKNCDKFGIVVHELGHVVGFWHEHTRPDRDAHVDIVNKNIMTGQEYNFNKLTDEEVNSLGLAYDFESIMHYARNTFSKNTHLDTILPQEDNASKRRPEIGQRVRLSQGDISQTNKLYKCPSCGRTLLEPNGLVSSPELVNSVTPPAEGEHCEWRITATHGERIVLNVTELDIYESDNCETDYIEVRDGYWHKSPLLGRYCGTGRIPEMLLSTGYRLLIVYRTSSNQNGHIGFRAYYEAVCGGDVDQEEGVLQSPNYPDDYRPNKECVWKITVPVNYQVALKFQSFEVENHDNCVYDYLEVRDGHEAGSPLLGKFCGYRTPDDQRSSSNKMLVKFVSDSSVNKPGFSATFMKGASPDYTRAPKEVCSRIFFFYFCVCVREGASLNEGLTKLHSAPSNFALNGLCHALWLPWGFPLPVPARKKKKKGHSTETVHRKELTSFPTAPQKSFFFSFEKKKAILFLSFQKKQACAGGARHSSVVSTLAILRSIPTPYRCPSTPMISVFVRVEISTPCKSHTTEGYCSNIIQKTVCKHQSPQYLWFECRLPSTCTHQISAPLGEINSPNYPDSYPSRKDCAWLFTTTPGHRLKLIFNDFELEPHQECAYDHISLYDGDSTDAPTLGRFCGAKVPHPILSTTNRMYMVFKSDASVQRKGFRAAHSTACGGRLLATGRTVEHLYSHAKYGDQNYENKEDCDWLVEAEAGRVRLRFLTFELEHEQDCSYDYVELFDGYDDSAVPLGKFCGNQLPGEFTSSSGSLLLRFRSDDNINAKGFSAAYSAVDVGEDSATAAVPSVPEVRTVSSHQRDRKLRLHRH